MCIYRFILDYIILLYFGLYWCGGAKAKLPFIIGPARLQKEAISVLRKASGTISIKGST